MKMTIIKKTLLKPKGKYLLYHDIVCSYISNMKIAIKNWKTVYLILKYLCLLKEMLIFL